MNEKKNLVRVGFRTFVGFLSKQDAEIRNTICKVFTTNYMYR